MVSKHYPSSETSLSDIGLLQKANFDANHVWFTDGLVFAHLESPYQQSSVNPLMLLWQTPETSFILPQRNDEGIFECVLKVNDDIDFETKEGEIFSVSIK